MKTFNLDKFKLVVWTLTNKFLIACLMLSLLLAIYNEKLLADIGVGNLRNFYTKYPHEEIKNKIDDGTPYTHQLFYEVNGNKLSPHFRDEQNVTKLKGKAVDIFGISYQSVGNTRYMYGGITLSGEYLSQSRNIPINLWIKGEHKTISTKRVSTNKKYVTAQEVDIKLRKYLQDEYNIYGHNNTGKGQEYGHKSKFYSGFNSGEVTFHLNSGENFKYELFYTGNGSPESFLKIYDDNKTIDSSSFHLDVTIDLKE
ncbi:exotoxin [Staphylococcus agnetis]|nr:exotoxin beta-grasp domain-containing protein [Staphylococcus agnetis]PTH26405.1 exotoxin [Staphylococcus agnetis]PTH37348.1 exotoxin [Staphylococcus agnetis]